MTTSITNAELKALKTFSTTVYNFTIENRVVFQRLTNNVTNEKHRTELERAEAMLEMLNGVITKLVDMTEVKLYALRQTEERLTYVEDPSPTKSDVAAQSCTNFQNLLEEVHRAQLSRITQFNLEISLGTQRANLTRSTDIGKLLEAVPGLVGLLRDVVLNLARYRNALFDAYATVDEDMVRTVARLMSVKYPVGYIAVRESLNAVG
jgi:hypothetical protein